MAATTATTINSTTFTLLGVAPVLVQTLGAPVVVVVADSLPAVGTAGFILQSSTAPTIFDPADASSNVYAAMFNTPSAIVYNLVSSQVG